MSRTLSSAGWAAITGRDTDAVFLVALEITTASSPSTTIRIVNNSEDVTYNGNTFTAFPFQPELPLDQNGQISEVRIAIDNVSRLLVDDLRSEVEPMSVSMLVLNMSTSPPSLEASFVDYQMVDAQYDALTVQGRLSLENFLGEPFPTTAMTPGFYPDLF